MGGGGDSSCLCVEAPGAGVGQTLGSTGDSTTLFQEIQGQQLVCVYVCYVIFPSDHAPVTPTINVSEVRPADMDDLTVCASQLGDHAVLHSAPNADNCKPQRKRPIKKSGR